MIKHDKTKGFAFDLFQSLSICAVLILFVDPFWLSLGHIWGCCGSHSLDVARGGLTGESSLIHMSPLWSPMEKWKNYRPILLDLLTSARMTSGTSRISRNPRWTWRCWGLWFKVQLFQTNCSKASLPVCCILLRAKRKAIHLLMACAVSHRRAEARTVSSKMKASAALVITPFCASWVSGTRITHSIYIPYPMISYVWCRFRLFYTCRIFCTYSAHMNSFLSLPFHPVACAISPGAVSYSTKLDASPRLLSTILCQYIIHGLFIAISFIIGLGSRIPLDLHLWSGLLCQLRDGFTMSC